MKREETVDYHIKATWHAIARMYNNEANKHGFTVTIGYILLNIDSEKGTPATKIAPLLGLEARSITRTLKSMEKEGYIYRKQDPQDKRSFRIFLTSKGKEKRQFSRETVKRFNHLVYQALSPEKLTTFLEVMQTINDILQKR